MKTSRFKFWYLGIIFMMLLIYLLNSFFKKRSLYDNYEIMSARVYEINRGNYIKGSGETVVSYFFYYNNIKYYGGIESGISYEIRSKLLNTNFPVLFDRTNPKNNVLLIDIRRWEKLGMKFPDSLNWIKKYYPSFYF